MVSDSPHKRPRGDDGPLARDQATSSSSLPPDPPRTAHSFHPSSTSAGSQASPHQSTSSSSGSTSTRKTSKRKGGSSGPGGPSKSRLQELQKPMTQPRPAPPQSDSFPEDGVWVPQLERDRMGFSRRYQLLVRQDPERARLCSFKEENVTTDRRPIDPPPIIEIRTSESDPAEFLECTSLFLRATLVAASPRSRPPSPPSQRWDANGNATWTGDGLSAQSSSSGNGEADLDQFDMIKTPTGGEATAGEVVLTPEKLKDTNGAFSSFCVFSKLSVRVPGVFRLKMTLYETIGHQVVKMASVLTDQFEVYSPKRFTGMKESTALTRHFAHQGLKIKLRAGSTVANVGKTRRAAPAAATLAVRAESPAQRPASRGDEDDQPPGPPRSEHEGRPAAPTGLTGPPVPFPDLPPFVSSAGGRVQLPSIGDLSAFSLRPSFQSPTSMHPPHHPGRPPHALSPWHVPPPHLLSPASEGPLPSPDALYPPSQDQPMRDATNAREMHHASHPFAPPPPPSHAQPGGSDYHGSHSLPEYGRYSTPAEGPPPPHLQWRERDWAHGNGGYGSGAGSTSEHAMHDYREPHSNARMHHRPSEASSSSSDGSYPSHPRHLHSPSSGFGSGGRPSISSVRDGYRPSTDYRGQYGSREDASDGRALSMAHYAPRPSDDYSARSGQGFHPGPGPEQPPYTSRSGSPESHWQQNYMHTSHPLSFPSSPGPGFGHHRAPSRGGHPHPPPSQHHAYHHHYDPARAPTTLPPLANSSSTPSSSSTIFSSFSGEQSLGRAMHAPPYFPPSAELRQDPSMSDRSSRHEGDDALLASGASMVSRPKKANSHARGGLDAHGYSHRSDEYGHPTTGQPVNQPYPYPSQPQHQYFPRGGGEIGSVARRLSGDNNWKEPLAAEAGVSHTRGSRPDGDKSYEVDAGRSQ